jgi:hypothetical protein
MTQLDERQYIMQWYYTRNKQKVGPVSSDQLRQLTTSGQIQPDDLVWKEGMAQWIKASQIKGLFIPKPVEPNNPLENIQDWINSTAKSARQKLAPKPNAWLTKIATIWLVMIVISMCIGIIILGRVFVGNQNMGNNDENKTMENHTTTNEKRIFITTNQLNALAVRLHLGSSPNEVEAAMLEVKGITPDSQSYFDFKGRKCYGIRYGENVNFCFAPHLETGELGLLFMSRNNDICVPIDGEWKTPE